MPKRTARSRISPRLILTILGALLVSVLVAQVLLVKDLYARTDKLRTQEIKDTIIEAVQSQNTNLAIDPQTGRQFIPSSRIVLPAKLDTRLYYRGGDEATVWLIDTSNQQQAVSKVRTAESLEELFKEVETLQKCSRQVVISFNANPNDSADKLALKSTKQLKDGRIAYIYQNDCPFSAEPLLRSLDQMNSY